MGALYLLCLLTFAVVTAAPNKKEEMPRCGGLRNPRIIGGNSAYEGSIPWAVSLQNENNDHFCGGSIVGERLILSASHCFHQFTAESLNSGDFKLKAVLGAYNLSSVDSQTSKTIKIERVILHEKFNKSDYRHDIAIVELSEDIPWSYNIRPVCLPEKSGVTSGTSAVASGWGQSWGLTYDAQDESVEKYSLHSDVLKTVTLTIYENSHCTSLYNNQSAYSPEFYSSVVLEDDRLCAGAGGVSNRLATSIGPGVGDSGGPLISIIDGQWTLVGIISAKHKLAGLPSIYVNVSHYMNWLKTKFSKFYKDN